MADSHPSHLAEILWASDLFVARRSGRYFVVELKSEHRVVSTSTLCGGQREDLRYLVNHQSCEARGDLARQQRIQKMGLKAYHREVCANLAIEADRTALMGTAASMAYIAHRFAEFEEVRADTFITAGVQGNATTAGDPAKWSETDSGWAEVARYEGTINTVLLLNVPLTPAAQATAVVTMTEAKSAALAGLAVPSRSSSAIATGTGTDQYCVAAPLDPSRKPKESTSTHVKTGEIIGRSVRDAVTEALRWQNGLESSLTRSLCYALARYGLDEDRLMRSLVDRLPERQMALLRENRNALLYEPGVGAAAHAMAAVLDRVRFGTLPTSAEGDALRQQAACLACSVAARPQDWPRFYALLDTGTSDPVELALQAVAEGWKAKWN